MGAFIRVFAEKRKSSLEEISVVVGEVSCASFQGGRRTIVASDWLMGTPTASRSRRLVDTPRKVLGGNGGTHVRHVRQERYGTNDDQEVLSILYRLYDT